MAIINFQALCEPINFLHCKAELTSNTLNPKAGEEITLALVLDLEKDWHIYWKNPGDSGIPTSFSWQLNGEQWEFESLFPTPQKFVAQGIANYGYGGRVIFLFKGKIPESVKDNAVSINCKANILLCKEECIPQMVSLTLTLPLRKAGEGAHYNQNPVFERSHTHPESVSEHIMLKGDSLFMPQERLSHDSEVQEVYFFPEETGWIHHDRGQKWVREGCFFKINLPLKSENAPSNTKGVLLIKYKDGSDQSFDIHVDIKHPVGVGIYQLLMVLTLAFIGGIILNVMPCVFPIISLKILGYVHGKHHIQDSLAYTLGILIAFLTLSLAVVILKALGSNLGWGFQMQSPAFITVILWIMFFVSLNLSNVVDVSWMPGATFQAQQKNTIFGSFITGLLAVAVATPCTAPFMATAIGYAFTQPSLVIACVFLSLGLGFSLPVLLFNLSSYLYRFIPKPGPWMNRVRHILSIPMYITVLWLLWILSRQEGQGVALVLFGLMAVTVLILLFAKHHLREWQSFSLLLVMALTSVVFIQREEGKIHTSQPRSSVTLFSHKTLEDLLKKGQPAVVFVTADWCLTCKVNEQFLLSNDILEEFKNYNVELLEADWTLSDPEITHFLSKYGRSGVPFYIYFPKEKGDPVILPQILTKSIIKQHLFSQP